MIGKAMRGRKVPGLLRYLYGAGKANEHENPRLVAGWDADLGALEPVVGESGRRDFRRLTSLLEQAPLVAGMSEEDRPVYHLVMRAAPEDRVLADVDWQSVAADVMSRTGLAPAGDDEGVRWVAVRHADDHIHIVATLARQDGKRVWPRNDFHRIREACHAAEQRLGLRSTAPGDRTAGIRPGRAESEKATRLGAREPARTTLGRKVRVAAARSESLDEFFFSLRQDGVLVRPRMSTRDPGQVTGYAVATPGMTDRAGQPIFYGGGKLAADLSLPQLLRRWDVTPTSTPAPAGERARTAPAPDADRGQRSRESRRQRFVDGGAAAQTGRTRLGAADRRRLYEQATAAAAAGAEHLAAAAENPAPGAGADAAWASADQLASAARLIEGIDGGPLTEAAWAFERAGRETWGRVPEPSLAGHGVRNGARLLGMMNAVMPGETRQVLALMAQLAALGDTLTRLREAQGRAEQAAAAHAAATAINADLMSRSVAAGPDVAPTPAATREPRQPAAARGKPARRAYGPPSHTWQGPTRSPGRGQDGSQLGR